MLWYLMNERVAPLSVKISLKMLSNGGSETEELRTTPIRNGTYNIVNFCTQEI